jgi:hypothetical protein
MAVPEDLLCSKAQWESARALRREANERVTASLGRLVSGFGTGPTEGELAHLKCCAAIEDEATRNYVGLLEEFARASAARTSSSPV